MLIMIHNANGNNVKVNHIPNFSARPADNSLIITITIYKVNGNTDSCLIITIYNVNGDS